MAATGFTPISLYYTTTASAVPVNTNLVAGELALNTTDEKLYFKNTAGTVKLIGANLMPVANGGTGVTTSTGTGSVVLNTSPTLVTPLLGTPTSGVMTNVTGLPISTGVSGLATGAATFLATPTSANMAAMLTDETGTGLNVFATSPTLVTPILGTPQSGTMTNVTGLPIATGVSGLATGAATFLTTPTSANFAAMLTDETGSGSNVFATSPTISAPNFTGGFNVVGTGYSPDINLTDAATVAWNTALGQVSTFTFVSASRIMGAPTNLVNGGFYGLEVIQNAGSNTLAWNTVFKWAGGTAPTLSTAAGARDYFVFRSDGTNMYEQGRSQGVA